MSIVFFCQSCGSRFDVEKRMAGKQGRCKKCGKQMAVPKVEEVRLSAARPGPLAVGSGVGAGPARATSWFAEVAPSQVGLAPLTIDRLPALKKPSMFAMDDLADSKPYLLAQPERHPGGRPGSQVSGVKVAWRRQFGFIEKIFRALNQMAYLISVPFLMKKPFRRVIEPAITIGLVGLAFAFIPWLST